MALLQMKNLLFWLVFVIHTENYEGGGLMAAGPEFQFKTGKAPKSQFHMGWIPSFQGPKMLKREQEMYMPSY